jgi:hypothetical protein
MNLFRVNFQELYKRHLCRHSQFGINVIHLAAVFGSYLALFALALKVAGSPWALLAILVTYLAALSLNLPLHVLLASLLFVALFCVLLFYLPPVPIWAALVLLILSHKGQAWSHKIYTCERDMTEFDKKYKKGVLLFVILSLYELPILLNYLCFDRKNWSASYVSEASTAKELAPRELVSEQSNT